MLRNIRNIITVVMTLVIIAVFLTGCACVDSFGPPRSMIQISVVDSSGAPVPEAGLTIYKGGTHQIAYEYPISNYTPEDPLISNQRGEITAIKKEDGPSSGGCYFLGILPIGVVRKPKYDCEIAADGYKTIQLDLWDLFKSSREQHSDLSKKTVLIEGVETELRLYQQKFVLEN